MSLVNRLVLFLGGFFSFVSLTLLAEGALAQSSTTKGYIFRGVTAINPADPKGAQLCDYPSNANCLTSVNGDPKGAYIEKASGLSATAKLQKLTFDFKSNGYFLKNPNGHIAVGLRGRITRDSLGQPAAINGRGFLLGTLGTDSRNVNNPACAGNMLEFESYHRDITVTNPSIPANHVFSDTCSTSIFLEGLVYRIELYVSSDRKIGVKIYNQNLQLLYSQLLTDPYDYIDPSFNNFFVAHVFNSDVVAPSGNWNFTVNNINLAQISTRIEDLFVTPVMPALTISTILSANTTSAQSTIPSAVNSFCSGTTEILYKCAITAAPTPAWVNVGGDCYHFNNGPQVACMPNVTTGQFCSGSNLIAWQCGRTSWPGAGWNSIGGGCYHSNQGTSQPCGVL